MAYNKRLESMLFNYETTGRTDFRGGEITPPVTTKYKEKGTCVRIRPPPLKDVHTLVDWHGHVPFNLYHKPKEMVRTNPRDVQKTFHKPPDEGHELAQATRPRLIMTPAVSLDDIKDNQIREVLVQDTYLSTAHRAMEEAVMLVRKTRVTAPLPGLPAPANPVFLPRVREPVVSPEWRRETVEWDSRQLRSHVDATREFWMPFNLYKDCVSCKETAQAARMKKMSSGKH